MGKQSARLWYELKDHKDIIFCGYHHNKMYVGRTLVWEKIDVHPMYSQFFMVGDVISSYGSHVVDEYGVRLAVNEGAIIEKCAVYLTGSGSSYRRTIACTGTGITSAKYVPYLSYQGKIIYDGLTTSSICEDDLTDADYFSKVYAEAVGLCTYLCKQYKLDPLGDGVIIGHYEAYQRGIGSNHGDPKNWFPRFGKSMDTLRADVKAELDKAAVPTVPDTPTDTSDNEKTIWDTLYAFIGNAYGTAGLMGNLYAESALKPTNLQNTCEKSLGYTDAAYTAAVDNGSYTNFVKDSSGYGLAQWTYWSRKQALLDYARAAGKSVGDLQTQLGFLCRELGDYAAVLKTLKAATNVKEASDIVLTQFEKPADQSDTVKTRRAAYGQAYYDKYAPKQTAPKKYYRVQLGAYSVKANADAMLTKVKAAGFSDAFIKYGE